MNKLIIFFLSLPLFIVPTVWAQTSTPSAREQISDKHIVLAKDEVLDRDYFAAGETVEIAGTVNGDVYAAGGKVIITGTINGDVLAVGGQVTIDGIVSQDVRVAGGQVTLGGSVGGNLTMAGGSLEVTKLAKLGGSVTVGGGSVTINAPVPKNIMAGAGQLTIGNTVAGDVTAGAGNLLLAADANIAGDLTVYTEEAEGLTLSESATVAGQTVIQQPPREFGKFRDEWKNADVKAGLAKAWEAFNVVRLIIFLAIGLVTISLFPKFSYYVINHIEEKPWQSFGLGLFATLGVPVLLVLLMITVVGIPLALLIMLFYAILIYISMIYFAYWLGARILDRLGREGDRALTFVIGAMILWFLTTIAIVGQLTGMIAVFMGMGALLNGMNRVRTRAQQIDLV